MIMGNRETSRRRFLQMATAGAAGLPFVNFSEVIAKDSAWTPKLAINPDIDNMKVVCCYDPEMLKSGAVMTNFTSQNNAVNADKVYTNLDEMACRLSGKSSPDQAWKTIFRSGKAWADTRVAIKVNCVNTFFMPRIAVIAKLCKVLSGFGVQGKNIVIYDGSANAYNPYSPYCSLTDSNKINAVVSNGNGALGGTTPVTIEGWTSKSFFCTADIALGKVDILINYAVNKGHDRAANGYFTLCMKNHYGTFGPPVDMHDNTTPFISINKHDALIGGNPVRQQLCIIDSLTGSNAHNPAAAPDVSPPGRLLMGTFAPAVDYLCVTKIREPIMKSVHNSTVVNSLLSYFGYTNSDPQWLEFKPGDTAAHGSNSIQNVNRIVSVHLIHGRLTGSAVHFNIDSPLNPITISISDIAGNMIRNYKLSGDNKRELSFQWDGKCDNGRDITAGAYIIRLRCGNWTDAGTMQVF